VSQKSSKWMVNGTTNAPASKARSSTLKKSFGETRIFVARRSAVVIFVASRRDFRCTTLRRRDSSAVVIPPPS
jgi:hypothetical protein